MFGFYGLWWPNLLLFWGEAIMDVFVLLNLFHSVCLNKNQSLMKMEEAYRKPAL
jgi:hypothetical protein